MRRRNLPLILCLVALLVCQHTTAQYTPLVLRDLPQLYYRLGWNSNQQRWDTTNRYFCDYDINGRLLREERQAVQTPGVWENAWLLESEYTLQPDSITTSSYYWDGGSWIRDSRKTTVKDSLGRVTHELQYLGSTAWVLQGGFRLNYLHNSSGNLEDILFESYSPQSATWDTSQLVHYSYGTGSTPDTATYDYYTNGQWYHGAREFDIQWQNFSRFKAKYLVRQRWDNNQYINDARLNCAFGPFDYRRCTTDFWDGAAWLTTMRDKNMQDSSGHLTDAGYDEYNASAWVIGDWIHFDHTYVGGKLAETIESYWDLTTLQLVPHAKYIYMDHAVEVAPPAHRNPLIAFPMPARDRLYVRADLRGPLHLRVYDLQGRLLLTQDSDADRLQASGIDISQVPSGLYLLQIEAARSRHAVRIQVQH